jgi:hypothetical protein
MRKSGPVTTMKHNLDSDCECMLNDKIHAMILQCLCSGTLYKEFGLSTVEQRKFLMRLGERLFQGVHKSLQELPPAHPSRRAEKNILFQKMSQ